MAMRDKLREAVSPYLQSDESVEEIFGAQTTSQYFALISIWIIVATKAYRVIAVTDRRILVCQASRWRITKIEGVIAEFPRQTLLGPPKGLWYPCRTLGQRMYVHKRFHKDIVAADSWAHQAPGPTTPSSPGPAEPST
jgi:hypothetical protein